MQAAALTSVGICCVLQPAVCIPSTCVCTRHPASLPHSVQQVVAPEQGDRAAGQGLKRKQPKVYDIWGGGPILEEAPLRQAHDPISHPHSMKRQKVSTR